MRNTISKLEVEFAILWSSGQWTDSYFEEYDIDLTTCDEKDIECGDPSPAYLDRLCQEFETRLNSRTTTGIDPDVVKVVVYRWEWKEDNFS